MGLGVTFTLLWVLLYLHRSFVADSIGIAASSRAQVAHVVLSGIDNVRDT